MNVVIYARFSSHSQTEQSIEGQLKVCYEYAESNHYTVVGEYIDRAISGTTDNRAEFQRMISDSDKHTFEGVLVYQLDRFARNRYDSAINKAKLKKNGVRVLSAKENIADDASGILVEGVLESMAEYYSVELSQKIHRGMAINAEKCLSNGSNPGLGFKVDAERRFYVDEEEAAIVREIYERYASGETKAEIIRDLKRRRVKTSLGKEFSPNSLSHLLSNKRYIGVYLYKGKETPGGMPRILDDDLFYRVQSMMNKNKNAPARTHGEGEYLLTTKLFCGHCKEMMVGYGGTSKTGRQYHYYMCKNARRKKCGKKIDNIPLDDIETAFEGETGALEGCSSLSTPAPPKGYYTNLFTLSAALPSQYGSSNTDRKERIFSLVESVRSFFMSCGLSTDSPWTVCGQSQNAAIFTYRSVRFSQFLIADTDCPSVIGFLFLAVSS